MPSLRPDPRNHAPTAQVGSPDGGSDLQDEQSWLELARSAFQGSTAYVDANYRRTWEDGLRAFNNQHPNDSKYNNPAYEKRSKVFRPKTRTVIRKNEAAAAAAFFSNTDVVSITAQDQTSKAEAASADVMKELLQYRLTKSIPWYLTLLGGLQDAQTVGVACAHIYWEYKEKSPAPGDELETTDDARSGQQPEGQDGEEDPEYPHQTRLPFGAMVASQDGSISTPEALVEVDVEDQPPEIIKDTPRIDLIPAENLRIDPGANWTDPINTSPYVIHLMPMYVLDVKDKMASGEWRTLAESIISAATELTPDSTRQTRAKDRDDPYGADNTSIDAYSIVWVQRHIHRRDGEDWEFYCMGDLSLLTVPRPLKDSVLHGIRPYVMGFSIIETHKIYPSGVAQIGKGLQDETNEIANQRLDNVKFVLNKKWFVKRGKEADIAGLVRNVPGGVVMLDNPQEDVREISWPDVTASSFQEAQGLGLEMDELLGNFNPAAIMTQGGGNNPARNMAMLGNAQGTLVEYLIRTFVETFAQPVLRQLVLLEQAYETDQVVMKIAAKRAKLFQKFGTDQVTDDLLRQELTLTVNVGMGATDPMQKLQKFLMAMSNYSAMLMKPTPGIDMGQVGKEIFGLLGYADGSRFFTNENPQVVALQQQMQHAQGVIAELQRKVAEKKEAHMITLQKTRETNQAGIQKTIIHEKEENKRALATHIRSLMEMENQHGHQRAMQALSPRPQ